MATSIYLDVWCRGCEKHIALAELISGPRIFQWILPRVRPFEVQCRLCTTRHKYSQPDIIVFEDEPTADFTEHPAFRNV